MVTITKEDLECPEELKQLPGESREDYRLRLESLCTFPGDTANVQLCVLELEDMEDELVDEMIKTKYPALNSDDTTPAWVRFVDSIPNPTFPEAGFVRGQLGTIQGVTYHCDSSKTYSSFKKKFNKRKKQARARTGRRS